MCDVIKIRLKRRDEGEVVKKIPKKRRIVDVRNFMTSHMTLWEGGRGLNVNKNRNH